MRCENPKKTKLVLKLLLATLLLAGVLVVVWPLQDLPDDTQQLQIAEATVHVEVVDTPEDRVQGLSGRESLSKGHGMLFVFEEPDVRRFHMKDMQFPLDIVWMDANMRVVDISHEVSPDTYPRTVSPRQPSQYVLEVPAGFSQRHNINTATTAELQEKQ